MLRIFSLLLVFILLSSCVDNKIIIVERSYNAPKPMIAKTLKTIKQPNTALNNKPKPTLVIKSFKKTPLWHPPIKSNIIQSFDKTHHGLTFQTKMGQNIYAVRAGKVAYADSQLKSQGKIIIIKHLNGFYSIYTQNQNLLIREGDTVRRGQVIATTGRKKFYFEIKRFSKFLDPKLFLKL
jgi:lipoprotein NlpD